MSNIIQESEYSLKISEVYKSFKFLPRVFRLFWKTHPLYFILILILNGIQGFIPAGILLATQHLINQISIVQSKSDFYFVSSAILILVGISILNEILQIIKDYINTIFQSMLVIDINKQIMEKSTQLSLSEFEDSEIQNMLKRAQSEANFRPFQVLSTILSLYSGGITLISTVSIVFIWNQWIAIALMLTPILFFYWFLRLGQLEFKVHYNRAHQERESWYLTFLLTKDVPFKEVKLYQLGEHLINRYQKINMQFLQQDKQIAQKRMWLSFIFRFFNQLLIGSLIFLVALSAFANTILIGSVVGLIQASTNTLSASQGIVQSVLSLCQNNLYLQQLFTFLDLEEESKVQNKESTFSINERINQIDICNLTFTYPNTDKPALHDINLSLKRGETLAIVGKNGSGKSTLVKCLTQLYTQYSGSILVNNIPLSEVDKLSYGKRIGSIFQDFVRYELSARENIGFGDINRLMDNDTVHKAAKNAGIDSVVNNLPEQLETQLGKWFEDGYQLSGGQWQRIAIARAFMRDADLYILDEPSSFLDPESENEVFYKFKKLVEDRIGIFVSHRYSSVQFADKILVMDEGTIKEYGTHQELLNKNGVYAELYRLQSEGYTKDVEVCHN